MTRRVALPLLAVTIAAGLTLTAAPALAKGRRHGNRPAGTPAAVQPNLDAGTPRAEPDPSTRPPDGAPRDGHPGGPADGTRPQGAPDGGGQPGGRPGGGGR